MLVGIMNHTTGENMMSGVAVHCVKDGVGMKAWWLLSLIIVFSAFPAEAAICTLEWDANIEPDLAGYRVYHSSSSNGYTAGEFSYRTQSTSATCEDLGIGMDGKLHYLTVTAYDTTGNESPFPAEVWVQMALLTESAPMSAPAPEPIPVPVPESAPAPPEPRPSPHCWWFFFRICP
jgi:hypothetical protein